MQEELFGARLLPGMGFRAEAINPGEERALIAGIEGSELSPFRFQQWTGKRMTASFGLHYDFAAGRLRAAAEMPGWLEVARILAGEMAGVDPGDFVHALVTRYDEEAGIGWHRDRPQFALVVGISLGTEAVLRFRRRREEGGFERFALTMPPRSAYLLSGPSRKEWEHSIAPMVGRRWSVTLRTLA